MGNKDKLWSTHFIKIRTIYITRLNIKKHLYKKK